MFFQSCSSNLKGEGGMNVTESEKLCEATDKVNKLKARIQELVSTMDKLTKNSDMSAQQSIELVNDLKRTNR